MHTDVNAILVAYEGRKGMLRFMMGGFGGTPDEPPQTGTAPALTPAIFDRMFGGVD